MNGRFFQVAFVAAFFVCVPCVLAQHRVPNGANVLMLAGGQRDHHAYRRQTYLLQKLLENTKNVLV